MVSNFRQEVVLWPFLRLVRKRGQNGKNFSVRNRAWKYKGNRSPMMAVYAHAQ